MIQPMVVRMEGATIQWRKERRREWADGTVDEEEEEEEGGGVVLMVVGR